MTTSMWIAVFSLLCLTASIQGRSHHREFESSELFYYRRASDFTATQLQMQKQALDAHNLYRTRHCVPSLVLDDDLNRSAQDYAEQLAQTNRFDHSDADDYGENLYMRTSSRDINKFDGQRKSSLFDQVLNRISQLIHSRCYPCHWLVRWDQAVRFQESSVLFRGWSLHAAALERLEETGHGFCDCYKWRQT